MTYKSPENNSKTLSLRERLFPAQRQVSLLSLSVCFSHIDTHNTDTHTHMPIPSDKNQKHSVEHMV